MNRVTIGAWYPSRKKKIDNRIAVSAPMSMTRSCRMSKKIPAALNGSALIACRMHIPSDGRPGASPEALSQTSQPRHETSRRLGISLVQSSTPNAPEVQAIR
jgi:hypothetical protein